MGWCLNAAVGTRDDMVRLVELEGSVSAGDSVAAMDLGGGVGEQRCILLEPALLPRVRQALLCPGL